MISTSLQVRVSGIDPVSVQAEQSWIKLTKDSPEKESQITKAQLADWLDQAYGIQDHCTGEKSDDAYVPGDTEDSTEQRLQGALSGQDCYNAADLLSMHKRCNPFTRAGWAKEFKVYAHCSSEYIRERYKFRCSSDISPSGPVRAESVIQVIVDFSGADEAPIYRYAEYKDVEALWIKEPPAWLGDVLVDNVRIDSSEIGIGWSNGKIVLSQRVSGRLVAKLPIKYDIWTVSVPGTIIDNKRDYSATAFAFDESLAEPVQIELDDEQEDPAEGSDCRLCDGTDNPLDMDDLIIDSDTGDLIGVTDPTPKQCQERIDWEVRNWCSNDLIDSGYRYEPTTCPDKRRPEPEVTYTTSQTPASATWTADEYKEACCEDVKKEECLTCKKTYRVYQGGAPVLPSEEYWREKYPNNQVVFNRVGRENDLPCGVRTDEFVSPTTPCQGCEVIAPLVWDGGNPTVIAPNGFVELEVTGGDYPALPIKWEITGGVGYYFAGGVQEVTNGRIVSLFAGSEPCGNAELKVSDDCSEVTGYVNTTDAVHWDYTYPGENPDTVYSGEPQTVHRVAGGVITPTFTLTGSIPSDVSLNDGEMVITSTAVALIVSETLCGDRNVNLSVTDGCTTVERDITVLYKGPLVWSDEYPGENPTTIEAGGDFGVYRIAGYVDVSATIWTLSGLPVSQAWLNGNVQVLYDTTAVGVWVASGVPPGSQLTLTVTDGCNEISINITTT